MTTSIAILSATLDARTSQVSATIAVAGLTDATDLDLVFGDSHGTHAIAPAADGGVATATVTMPAGAPRRPWPAFEIAGAGAHASAAVADATVPHVAISAATLIRETGELSAQGYVIGRLPGDMLTATLAGAPVARPRSAPRKDVHVHAPWNADEEPGWRLVTDVAVASPDALPFGVALIRDSRVVASAVRQVAAAESASATGASGWALLPMRGDGVPDFDRCARMMTPRTRRRLIASRAFQREWSHPQGRVAQRLRRAIVTTMVTKGEAAGPLAIRLSTGALVEADPAIDEVIARRFLLDGIYERGLIDWVQGFLKTGDGAFDVGACYGHVAMAAAATVGRGGQVVAIEANPGTARMLRRDLALNPALTVRVVETAVGDRVGTVRFMAVDSNLGGSRMAGADDSEDKARALLGTLGTVSLAPGSLGGAKYTPATLHEVEVPMRTLDAIVEEVGFAPRLMKMDIEGAELLALRGASGLLSGKYGPPPWIAMEYSALFPMLGGRREDVFDLLVANGYRAWKMKDGKGTGGELIAVPTTADAPRHDDLIFEPPAS